jgi:hypothetical protein
MGWPAFAPCSNFKGRIRPSQGTALHTRHILQHSAVAVAPPAAADSGVKILQQGLTGNRLPSGLEQAALVHIARLCVVESAGQQACCNLHCRCATGWCC